MGYPTGNNRSGKNQRLDVVILKKGLQTSVEIGSALRGTGWTGGTFVTYSAGTAPLGRTGRELGIVERSPGTGIVAGFLLFGSSDASEGDEYFTSYRPESTGVAAININEGKYKFFVYESENAAKRADPAAGADLTYVLNDRLYVSDRGLLTNEQEFGGNSVVVGICFHTPVDDLDHPELNYVGIQVSIEQA
jgi:hypothetical protein